ncbi:MAG: flagellar hook-basal body protein [Planctomycetota bacterium]|jgi:flagellar basal body rod protein FlgG
MNYGLYLAAGGAMRGMHRLDVVSNNLANVNTVGFKPDTVVTGQRLPERLEAPRIDADPKHMLEQLGGGVFGGPTRIRMAQGRLEQTGNAFDIAIEGNGFLVVQHTATDGTTAERLTRDGRLARDANGRLVLAGTGQPVLGARGRTIRLDDRGPVDIGTDGTVRQNGMTRGQLRVVTTDESNLVKDGQNLLQLRDGDPDALRPATGSIRQHHVEHSAVDPVLTLRDLIEASKAIEANAQMMQYHDHIIGQTVNTFGRVA